MPKIQKAEPFFIALANTLQGINITGIQGIDRIKSALRYAQKQYPTFEDKWRILNNELDGQSREKILMYCDILRNMVFELAHYGPKKHAWLKNLNTFLKNVTPIVILTDKKKFVLSGMSGSKKDFIGELSFEIAEFLTKDYRPELISVCKLNNCQKYILTWTGRKYCSKAHMRKRYDQQRMNKPDTAERDRIRNRLNKKYNRKKRVKPSIMKKKYPQGWPEYKKANWPPEKIDLLDQ